MAVNFGPLPDPDDNRAIQRGTALGDLTWNPALKNPFLQNDDGSEQRQSQGRVDGRGHRHATSWWSSIAVIVSRKPISTLSMDRTRPAPTRFQSHKFQRLHCAGAPDGAVQRQPWRVPQVHDAQGGPDINVTPPAGSGEVFIGARTINDYRTLPMKRIVPSAASSRSRRPSLETSQRKANTSTPASSSTAASTTS